MFKKTIVGVLLVAALAVSGVIVNGVASADTLAQLGPAVGDPWSASGTIDRVDDFGFWLAPDDGGAVIYVELGPPSFWQMNGASLTVGDVVDVQGYAAGTLYHAAIVTTASGDQIIVRDETGFPLWAGGRNAGANGLRDGSRVPQPQVQVDRETWETITGEVVEVLANSITVELADGTTLLLGLGRAALSGSSGVSFAAGDEVMVSGFSLNGRFVAGEIENLTQGGNLTLRDESGRPVWAGGPDQGMQLRQGAQGRRGAQVGPGAQTRPEEGRGRAAGGGRGRGGW